MKKRLIPILLVVVMLISVFPVHAVETAPTFVVDSVTAEAGETVNVTISVKNNPGIASIKLSVTYDEALTLNSITYNTAIGGMSQQPQSKASPVTLNWFNGAADSTGDWVFATLSFTVNANAAIGDYDVSVTYEADNVYNIAEENVDFAIENGKVEVICGHKNTTNVAEVPPTCAQSGFTAGVYCNDCQSYISGHEVIERTGEHSDADGKWNYDENGHWCQCACGFTYAKGTHTGGSATCSTKAVCDTCHAEYGSVDASAHGQTEVRNASAATCNQDGYTGDICCMDCGEIISSGSVIPATGEHSDADGLWDHDEDGHYHVCACGQIFDAEGHFGGITTCQQNGICEICGGAFFDAEDVVHLNTGIQGAVDATCGKDGYTGDVYCLDCGHVFPTGEVIPATGKHTGGEAGCVSQAICQDCGTAYGDWDADNHGETEIKGTVEPDCSNAGYTGDTYCVDCGKLVELGSMIGATDEHTDSDGDELCDDCGADLSCKHTGGEATCAKQAVCEKCGKPYGALNTDNHGETEIKGAVEPDCGNAGYTGDTYCVDCGERMELGSMIGATNDHIDADDDALCDGCGAEMPQTDKPNEDKPSEENPETGDFSMVWISMLMVCSMVAAVWCAKKKSVA